MLEWPGLLRQIQPPALIPVSGHRERKNDVVVLSNCTGLAATFPGKCMSKRLPPGTSDTNAPNKPS